MFSVFWAKKYILEPKLLINFLSLALFLISNLTNELRLHQFLVTKSGEANKSKKLMQTEIISKITNEKKD